MVLMGLPRVHPGPEGVVRAGPAVPPSPLAADRWLRSSNGLGVRTDTRWTGRKIALRHGGWLFLLRENYRGHPIAGALVERGPNRYYLDSWLEHPTELGQGCGL